MERKIKIVCSQCGFETSDNSTEYCPICGKKILQEDIVTVMPEKAAEPEAVSEPKKKTESVRKTTDQQRSDPVSHRPIIANPIFVIPVLAILFAVVGVAAYAMGLESRENSSASGAASSRKAESAVTTTVPTKAVTPTATPTPTAAPTSTPAPTAKPTSTPTPTPTPSPTEAPETEHLYRFFMEDCTWTEAFAAAIRKGGHLVTIETEEEYQKIVKQAETEGYKGNEHFYIGGMRKNDSYSYYWVDENKKQYGNSVNSSSGELSGHWLKGEPTFTSGADSKVFYEETVLMLLRFEDTGKWVLNDIPDDILEVAPYYSGKLGYICEFEG